MWQWPNSSHRSCWNTHRRGDHLRHQPGRHRHLRRGRSPSTRPPGRIFGSGTVLDSGRFRFLIGQRAGVAVGNVHGAIVGEHGDSEIPLWSSVSIGGVPAEQFRTDGALVFDEPTRAEISADVVNAAYEIIEGKGATNLAIGLSTARIIEAVLGNQHRVLPVSTVQNGPTKSLTSRCRCRRWCRQPGRVKCCRRRCRSTNCWDCKPRRPRYARRRHRWRCERVADGDVRITPAVERISH